MFLSDEIQPYWGPVEGIRKRLCDKYKGKRVLEIGPGLIPFEVATDFVDCTDNKECVQIDIDKDRLPYQDHEFDFLYARHVLEDIQNPDFAFKEMTRVAKSGYLETPSPLVECTKNVDGRGLSHLYRGYIHHRYIVWTEMDTNTLCFLPKYPILECISFNDYDLELLKTDYYWNNYYEWSETQPINVRMYKNGVNFKIQDDYVHLLNQAISASIQHTRNISTDSNAPSTHL